MIYCYLLADCACKLDNLHNRPRGRHSGWSGIYGAPQERYISIEQHSDMRIHRSSKIIIVTVRYRLVNTSHTVLQMRSHDQTIARLIVAPSNAEGIILLRG